LKKRNKSKKSKRYKLKKKLKKLWGTERGLEKLVLHIVENNKKRINKSRCLENIEKFEKFEILREFLLKLSFKKLCHFINNIVI